MRILGIETSCDETAIAVVKGHGERLLVEKNLVYSQVDEFAKLGGVVPEMAARLHLEKIMPLLEKAVGRNGRGIDVISVTVGPGLAPALRTGVEVAKTLAWVWKKPIVGVSHMEGHIAGAWLQSMQAPRFPGVHLLSRLRKATRPELPALCLLVSGGHTELVLMEAHTQFTRIGETIDDAAGEAFDKVAKMMGLPYPGGPQVAELAQAGNRQAYDFPRGLMQQEGYDFSFSGLKTALLYTLRDHEEQLEDPHFRADIAASFEEAVVDALARKTDRAIRDYQPKSVIVAGGVSANKELRKRFEQLVTKKHGIELFFPEFTYSLDNAAMIAGAGYFRYLKKGAVASVFNVAADPNYDLCKQN